MQISFCQSGGDILFQLQVHELRIRILNVQARKVSELHLHRDHLHEHIIQQYWISQVRPEDREVWRLSPRGLRLFVQSHYRSKIERLSAKDSNTLTKADFKQNVRAVRGPVTLPIQISQRPDWYHAQMRSIHVQNRWKTRTKETRLWGQIWLVCGIIFVQGR